MNAVLPAERRESRDRTPLWQTIPDRPCGRPG